MRLLDVATASANGDTFVLPRTQNRDYRVYTLMAWGSNFDGATVKLQISPDGTNWIDVYSFTADGAQLVEFKAYAVRGVIENAGASTSVSLDLS